VKLGIVPPINFAKSKVRHQHPPVVECDFADACSDALGRTARKVSRAKLWRMVFNSANWFCAVQRGQIPANPAQPTFFGGEGQTQLRQENAQGLRQQLWTLGDSWAEKPPLFIRFHQTASTYKN
jgi:hypothetical protein